MLWAPSEQYSHRLEQDLNTKLLCTLNTLDSSQQKTDNRVISKAVLFNAINR